MNAATRAPCVLRVNCRFCQRTHDIPGDALGFIPHDDDELRTHMRNACDQDAKFADIIRRRWPWIDWDQPITVSSTTR